MPAADMYGNFCLSCDGWGAGRLIVFAKGKDEYSGHVVFVGAPSSLKIMEISSSSPFAWKRGSFNSSSANMQPTDHISTAVEYVVAPSNISGAL